MRKLFNLVVLLTVLASSFMACKDEKKDEKKTENLGEKVDLLEAWYFKKYSSMDVFFVSQGSFEGKKPVKDEFVLYAFSIIVKEPGTKLANGIYTEADLDPKESYLNLGKADFVNEKKTAITNAKIVVEDNMFKVILTGENGVEYRMYYEGNVTFDKP